MLAAILSDPDWQLIASAGAFMAGLGGLLSGVAALRLANKKGKEQKNERSSSTPSPGFEPDSSGGILDIGSVEPGRTGRADEDRDS